jgi:hypothetical protein
MLVRAKALRRQGLRLFAFVKPGARMPANISAAGKPCMIATIPTGARAGYANYGLAPNTLRVRLALG